QPAAAPSHVDEVRFPLLFGLIDGRRPGMGRCERVLRRLNQRRHKFLDQLQSGRSLDRRRGVITPGACASWVTIDEVGTASNSVIVSSLYESLLADKHSARRPR